MNPISIDAEAQRAAMGARKACRKHTTKKRALRKLARLNSGGAKILPGLLVLAAAAGIGYCLLCLVDLVESCALFGSEVARLVP